MFGIKNIFRHLLRSNRKSFRTNTADGLFFPEGYLVEYPDVAKAEIDPWRHYVLYGKKEGRDNGKHPAADLFFPEGYLAEYPDVAKAEVEPWHHYVMYGKKEGRDNGLHPKINVFFAKGYLVMYPDVAETKLDPWRHYVMSGKKEGRDNGLHPKSTVFSAAGYLDMYPDVEGARIDPWLHYVTYGEKEGRCNGLAQNYLINYACLPTHIRDYPYIKKTLDIDLSDVNLSPKMVFPCYAQPMVSIVIPCYNHFDVTMRCLRSVLKNTSDVSYEVIVADDHSTDQTKNLNKFVENVKYITNDNDNGFVNNCNSGASIAKGKYIYFLNNDTQVQPGYLSNLVDLIERDTSIGIVGSMLVSPEGTIQEAGGQIFEDCQRMNVGRGLKNIEDVSVNYVRDTDYISGTALMIQADLFRVLGGFDQIYAPAYGEDSDLCLRVWYYKHKRVVFQPKSRVVHFGGLSFDSDYKMSLINKNNLTLFNRFFKYLSRYHSSKDHSTFVFKDHASDKKQMLVIDWKILSPSLDTGSRVTFQYLQLFMKMGMNVKLYPQSVDFEKPEFLDDLEQIGVEVIFEDFISYIAKNGKCFDYVFINRPIITKKYIKFLRIYTKAQIIYQGHDLHYLRHYRENLVNKKANAEEIMKKERKREFEIIRSCDVPCFVSQDEVDLVNKANPFSHCIKIPIYLFDVKDMTQKYKADERKDICFVAGFGHRPNIDGACWFVKEVLPLVRKHIPELKFYLIGSNPPNEVLSLASDSVIVTGYVTDEELKDYYSKVKMAVVPLNFGAGVKGKTVEAVYNKVPVLTTKIGAEGIDNSMGILTIENEPESFAEKLVEMYNSDNDLQRISDMSASFIKNQFTKEKAIGIFSQFLRGF